MVRRCTQEKDPHFANYGGRGISVFPEWMDVRAYVAYVERELGPQPSPEHSIDRIDNERGYEPGNLRWATRSEQNKNQRQRLRCDLPVGQSGHRGVRLHKRSGLWQARVHRRGREISLGYYATPELAAAAREAAL